MAHALWRPNSEKTRRHAWRQPTSTGSMAFVPVVSFSSCRQPRRNPWFPRRPRQEHFLEVAFVAPTADKRFNCVDPEHLPDSQRDKECLRVSPFWRVCCLSIAKDSSRQNTEFHDSGCHRMIQQETPMANIYSALILFLRI